MSAFAGMTESEQLESPMREMGMTRPQAYFGGVHAFVSNLLTIGSKVESGSLL